MGGWLGGAKWRRFDVSKSKDTSDSQEEYVNSGNGIDPFKNLTFVISGISPYCEIAVNNSACSKDVQNYVSYSFDKEHYANGETATITAALSLAGQKSITLSRTKYSYQIKDQPEYISSVTGVNLNTLKNELNDYMTGTVGSSLGTGYIFNVDLINNIGYGTFSSIQWNIQNQYFSCLKPIKQNEMDSQTPYNKYSFIQIQ